MIPLSATFDAPKIVTNHRRIISQKFAALTEVLCAMSCDSWWSCGPGIGFWVPSSGIWDLGSGIWASSPSSFFRDPSELWPWLLFDVCWHISLSWLTMSPSLWRAREAVDLFMPFHKANREKSKLATENIETISIPHRKRKQFKGHITPFLIGQLMNFKWCGNFYCYFHFCHGH